MENLCRSSNRISIDTGALQHNYRLLQSRLPEGGRLLAMVKGDAYGHGMVESARAFYEAGCRVFGVAELSEGVALRDAGVAGEIFIMVGFPPEYGKFFFSHRLTPVISSLHAAQLLSEIAVAEQDEITLHLKIDCGMSRLGVEPQKLRELAEQVEQLPGIKIGGVVSHFPFADDENSPHTRQAFAVFSESCSFLAERVDTFCHIANSGAILNFPETLGRFARAGIALYGYSPAAKKEQTLIAGETLRPAMRYATRIFMVKTVAAGTGISYGHSYVTTRETRLAVLPVGYEDGYPRCLSSRGEVLIHGQRAPILGRICMNICMVDITDIDGVAVGDEAVLLGTQGTETITADDIAAWAGTISYEILCMLGNNNERTFV